MASPVLTLQPGSSPAADTSSPAVGSPLGVRQPSIYAPTVEKEYQFWMDGHDIVDRANPSFRRVVILFADDADTEGYVLNRFWDDSPDGVPRQESYKEDVELADHAHCKPENRADFYRHIRAAAESGWDFSSRWFGDGLEMKTICTTDIMPIDLNCLLLHMEHSLAHWYAEADPEKSRKYAALRDRRKRAIQRFFWCPEQNFYFDYNWRNNKRTEVWSLAGAYPLFIETTGCTTEQAALVVNNLTEKFMAAGGWVNTWRPDSHVTTQQWDYPNGWAPLQWVVIKGLRNYGYAGIALNSANRWMATNRLIFKRTHKMMEKYNVVELGQEAGGGEYSLQTGFGWTNGVFAALVNTLPMDAAHAASPLSSVRLSSRRASIGSSSPMMHSSRFQLRTPIFQKEGGSDKEESDEDDDEGDEKEEDEDDKKLASFHSARNSSRARTSFSGPSLAGGSSSGAGDTNSAGVTGSESVLQTLRRLSDPPAPSMPRIPQSPSTPAPESPASPSTVSNSSSFSSEGDAAAAVSPQDRKPPQAVASVAVA